MRRRHLPAAQNFGRVTTGQAVAALRAQRSIAKREAESEFRQHRKCLIIGLAAMLGYLRSPDTSSLSVAHRALLALQSAEFSARGEFSSAWRLWLAPLQRLAACQLRYTVSPSGRAPELCSGRDDETTHVASATSRPGTISQEQMSQLCRRGFAIVENFIPRKDIEASRRRILNDNTIAWRVPTNSGKTRDDKIAWLTDMDAAGAEEKHQRDEGSTLLAEEQTWFRSLREQLCSRIRLTTKSSETRERRPDEFQLAVYHTGARGYVRHYDADESIVFRPVAVPRSSQRSPKTKRVVTAVLYLNSPDISTEIEGGELRLWPPSSSLPSEPRRGNAQEFKPTTIIDVPPRGGTLVLFLSGAVSHQVRKIKLGAAPRIALTAWFHGSASF